MNPDELRELARTFAGAADGKPWQFTTGVSGPWIDADANRNDDPVDKISRGLVIRIKPWELTGTVNGHTLPPGREWHRVDGWTEDMLPAGTRPLMLGEKTGTDVELYSLVHGKWISEANPAFFSGAAADWGHHRTTRPIPFALTPEQITDGWLPWNGGECPVEPKSLPEYMLRNRKMFTREAFGLIWEHNEPHDLDIIAYRPDPHGHLRQALADGKVIEFDSFNDGRWYQYQHPDFSSPPDRYRIKEPQWVKLGPDDIPPGSVFRNIDRSHTPVLWWSVDLITEEGVALNGGCGVATFAELAESCEINRPRHRDADGNPTLWEECRKEAP